MKRFRYEYGVADNHNGVFEVRGSLSEARALYSEEMRRSINAELEIQEESGLSQAEIEVKVKDFLSIWALDESGQPVGEDLSLYPG